jgi:hypothetical protein
MPIHTDSLGDLLKDRLSRYREITITVTGRKSGRDISVPVWFVFENDKLFLLPVHGSDTQWYKNVLKHASMASMRAAKKPHSTPFRSLPPKT